MLAREESVLETLRHDYGSENGFFLLLVLGFLNEIAPFDGHLRGTL